MSDKKKSKSELTALEALRAATNAATIPTEVAPPVDEKPTAPTAVLPLKPQSRTQKAKKVNPAGADAAIAAVVREKEKELAPLPHNIRLYPRDAKLVDDICDLIRKSGKRRPSMADAIRVALRSFDMNISSSEIERLLPEYFNK